MFHNNVQIGIRTTKLQSADTGMMYVLIRTVYGKQMKVHTCSAEREREREREQSSMSGVQRACQQAGFCASVGQQLAAAGRPSDEKSGSHFATSASQ